MVAALGLSSILGAGATALLAWPTFGWMALSMAPAGGSLATLLVGILIAARRGDGYEQDSTDQMVADLRSVLSDAERPATDRGENSGRSAAA